MMQISSDQVSSRREFFKFGSAGAAAAALGAFHGNARAESFPAINSIHNVTVTVTEHGARGDGRADDTEAFRAAIAQAKAVHASQVYVPAGIYMLSGTLRLPSNLRLCGAGRGLTTLKAMTGTLFDMFKPDPRSHEARRRRTMITTESVGSVREQVVQNIAIEHMTIDWNHCPTDSYGHSVVLMDSCDHAHMNDVNLINCIPSDHPTTPEAIRRIGHNFRCECVMYSNAYYGIMDQCRLTDSGYRPLSVSYGSQKITFQNGIIHAENPIRRHVFAENHHDGLPRDETFVHSEMIFLNSTLILEKGRGGFDGIASHTGTTHVENCDFYIAREASEHFAIILKPFDGSRNCTYINNRFHLEEGYPSQFCVIGTDVGMPVESVTFAGNIINVTYGPTVEERWRTLVRFASGSEPHRRIIVRDNLFNVDWEAASQAPSSMIQLRNVESFVVANNIINTHAQDAEKSPKTGIMIRNATNGTVLGNCAPGIVMDDEIRDVIAQANCWTLQDV